MADFVNPKPEVSAGGLGGIRYKHPAMAVVSFSRCQCSGRSLFGSAVKHNHYIQLRIKRASLERELGHDWYFGSDTLVELDFSPAQFAELLTSMNRGEGVPATLSYYEGKSYASPDLPMKSEHFKAEIKTHLQDSLTDMRAASDTIAKALANPKPMTKAELKVLQSQVDAFNKLANDKLPFLMASFEEQMEDIVVEAKAAVDACIQQTYIDTGIETLRKQQLQIGDGE